MSEYDFVEVGWRRGIYYTERAGSFSCRHSEAELINTGWAIWGDDGHSQAEAQMAKAELNLFLKARQGREHAPLERP